MAVYAMSASGNTLYAAKEISNSLHLPLHNILRISGDGYRDPDDIVGIICPLYDFKPHTAVIERLQTLRVRDDAYVFFVATYGIAPRKAYRYIKRNTPLCFKAGFGLKMPHNGIGSAKLPSMERNRILSNSKISLQGVIDSIRKREESDFISSSPFSVLSNKLFLRALPSVFILLMQMLFQGVKSLEFCANDECIGCGVCVNVCPVDNITLLQEKPQFGTRCLNCFSCIHNCPKGAVSFGGNQLGVRPYRNPAVSLEELMNFNSKF